MSPFPSGRFIWSKGNNSRARTAAMADCECHKYLGDGWILESGSEPAAKREWERANRGDRRNFLKRIGLTAAGLTCGDFLGFFGKHGLRADEAKFAHKAKELADKAEPRFLVYWFLEGGWDSYDMFSPVVTPNNIFPNTRLDRKSTRLNSSHVALS